MIVFKKSKNILFITIVERTSQCSLNVAHEFFLQGRSAEECSPDSIAAHLKIVLGLEL